MKPKIAHGVFVPGSGIGPLRIRIVQKNAKWMVRCPDVDVTVESTDKEKALAEMKRRVRRAMENRRGDIAPA